MDEYTHRFQAQRACPTAGYGDRAIIKVDAGLHYLSGNARPYFYVSAEIWERPKARDCAAYGCLHEDVAKYWPQLTPIIALHLSSDNGQPMHAEANGWYQLAGYYQTNERYHAGNSKGHHAGEYREPTPNECLAQFAAHIRIPVGTARTLAEEWRRESWGQTRQLYAEWLNGQAARFQSEADAAIALLDSLRT